MFYSLTQGYLESGKQLAERRIAIPLTNTSLPNNLSYNTRGSIKKSWYIKLMTSYPAEYIPNLKEIF